MKKIYKLLIFLFILLLSNNLLALNSSSYLISQSAFKNYDFTTVLYQFSKNNGNFTEKNFLDELISSTITINSNLANKISNQILSKDPDNQEARVVLMIINLLKNKQKDVLKYRLDSKKQKNELIEFIFFIDEKLKNKNEVSNSLIDIVKTTYSSAMSTYETKYDFLLFYSSLAILINPDNAEAQFIRAQLFQIIEKYVQAESGYLNIDQSTDYYIDAQRSIAYNFTKIYEFNIAEKKIQQIIKKNNNNYLLKKILADFYRVEKKYSRAIEKYNELISEDKNDLWNMYYLRGICYERQNLWDLAENDFLKSLEIKENSPDVLNYLAYGWIEKNLFIEKAFLMLSKAYASNPDSYYILDSLAWAYYKKNNLIKAAELMEKVIDMVPGEAISLDHLGDIYFAMNRKREARHFWKQAMDLAEIDENIKEKIKIKLRNDYAG